MLSRRAKMSWGDQLALQAMQSAADGRRAAKRKARYVARGHRFAPGQRVWRMWRGHYITATVVLVSEPGPNEMVNVRFDGRPVQPYEPADRWRPVLRFGLFRVFNYPALLTTVNA